MANRNEQLIDRLNEAIDKLDLSEQILTEAQATTDPETRIAKLTSAIAWHEDTVIALILAQIAYNGGILVLVGNGAGDGNLRKNLLLPIYSQPAEAVVYNPALAADDDGQQQTPSQILSKSGYPQQSFEITIAGRYRVRDDGSNDEQWYRVQYILPNQALFTGWMPDFTVEFILENSVTGVDPTYLSQLPEQDRDGMLVYTLIYDINRAATSLYRAPILGNDRLFAFAGNNARVLRVRAYADDASVFGEHRYLEVKRYDVSSLNQDGWLDTSVANTISEAELNVITAITPDKTAIYGGAFQAAVDNGTVAWPTSPFAPIFTHYPLSVEAACVSHTTHGLGNPYRPQIYPDPSYHIGADFFAPDNATIFSIGDNGLVIGIGERKFVNGNAVLSGSARWGAVEIEEGQTGYNIVTVGASFRFRTDYMRFVGAHICAPLRKRSLKFGTSTNG